MKVSIIIPTFNSKEYIVAAITSVLTQNYGTIECIVVDGGSRDGTVEILAQYGSRIRYISESDNGIFDALNKGIRMATGEIIGWLGSDDFYENENVVSRAVQALSSSSALLCWGDLLYVRADSLAHLVRYWKSTPYTPGLFRRGWQMPHFSSFIKKEVFDKHGYFNTAFHIAADYDFFLRVLEKDKVQGVYEPEIFLRMRVGGKSNRSIKNIIRGAWECFRAWHTNRLWVNPITLFLWNIWHKKHYTYLRVAPMSVSKIDIQK